MCVLFLNNMLDKKRKGVFLFVIVSLVIFSFFASAVETSSVLLKVSVKQGVSVDRTIGVSSDKGGEFVLELMNLKGVRIGEERFVLNSNERKDVSVIFNSAGLSPGVYAGKIKITGGGEESFIPIVFEIESKDLFFDVNLDIPPQYTDVEPGGNILAQVKIFDLVSSGTSEGLGATPVDTEYFIVSLDGKTLSSETENVVVDQQNRITKTVSLPEDIPEGDYVFVSSVKYKSSVGVSSQLFSVSKKGFQFSGDIFQGPAFIIIIIIGAIFLFFLMLVFLFIYLIHDRDKLIFELKKYNSWEIQKEKKVFSRQKEMIKKQVVMPERPKRYRALKEKTERKIVNLKSKQKKRISEFEKLRRTGDTATMLRKIQEWRKQGYNTVGVEKTIKGLSVLDMKKRISEWKKKGYKKGKTEGYKKKK